MPSHRAPAGVHDDQALPALTGIRFFAAASVLLSHFSQRGTIALPAGAHDFLDGGRTAVCLFFVLSGFILTYNYSDIAGLRDRVRFFGNRLARIFPTTLLALAIASVGVVYALSHPPEMLQWFALTTNDPAALTASFLAQVTMTVGWFPFARINQPWNGPAWSIACEMFFYALFPLLVVRLRRLSGRALATTAVLAYAGQIALIVALRAAAPNNVQGFLIAQFPVTHLVEFVAGIVVSLWFLRGGRAVAAAYRGWILAGSLTALVLLAWLRPVDPAYLLMTPFFATLILALAVPPKSRGSVLAWPPLILLGEASFALYMTHVPLLNIYTILGPPSWLGWPLVALTVGLSVAIFTYFERPTRRGFRRRYLALAERALPSRSGDRVQPGAATSTAAD